MDWEGNFRLSLDWCWKLSWMSPHSQFPIQLTCLYTLVAHLSSDMHISYVVVGSSNYTSQWSHGDWPPTQYPPSHLTLLVKSSSVSNSCSRNEATQTWLCSRVLLSHWASSEESRWPWVVTWWCRATLTVTHTTCRMITQHAGWCWQSLTQHVGYLMSTFGLRGFQSIHFAKIGYANNYESFSTHSYIHALFKRFWVGDTIKIAMNILRQLSFPLIKFTYCTASKCFGVCDINW